MMRRYWSYCLPIPITAERSIPQGLSATRLAQGLEPCRSDQAFPRIRLSWRLPGFPAFRSRWRLFLPRCLRLHALEPLLEVDRPVDEALLQVGEDVAPSAVEILVDRVPLLALAPAHVMQRHLGALVVERTQPHDDERALRADLGVGRRRIP